MASTTSPPPSNLTSSGITIPSDSENYDANNELSSSSPPSTDSTPLILYKPPTIWGLLRGAAINLLLPFVNGLMLGFGELVANEAAYRLGWSGTKVREKHELGRRNWDCVMGDQGIRMLTCDADIPDTSLGLRFPPCRTGCRDARRSCRAKKAERRGTGYDDSVGVNVGRQGDDRHRAMEER
jgi:hypothetical protein